MTFENGRYFSFEFQRNESKLHHERKRGQRSFAQNEFELLVAVIITNFFWRAIFNCHGALLTFNESASLTAATCLCLTGNPRENINYYFFLKKKLVAERNSENIFHSLLDKAKCKKGIRTSEPQILPIFSRCLFFTHQHLCCRLCEPLKSGLLLYSRLKHS